MPVVRRHLPIAAALLVAVAPLVMAIGACGGGEQSDLAAFCEKLGVASGPEGALDSLAPNDPDAVEVASEELDSLHRAAPLEIKPSLAVINDTVGLVLTALSGSEAAGQESLQKMDSEMAAYSEAATELARFAAEHCGLDLNPDTPVVVFDADRITGEVRLDVAG